MVRGTGLSRRESGRRRSLAEAFSDRRVPVGAGDRSRRAGTSLRHRPSGRPGPGRWSEPKAMTGVAIVIPMLNEAPGLPRVLRSLAALEPPPAEVLAVDGGNTDASVAIAEAAGLLVVRHETRGRAAAINRGVQEATAPIICVLHADTLLPDDAVAVMRRVLADPGTALAGFTPLLSGPDRVRWGTSFHNWIKTWYAPLLFRPQLFLRGARLLFGDHAMFFRRADFRAVGGCDPTLLVMEEADLCIRFHRLGPTPPPNPGRLGQNRGRVVMGKLQGKVALVTGSGRNIGRATVLHLAREGAHVIVNARSNQAEADAVVREAQALGVRAISIIADMAKKDQVEAMAAKALSEFGRVDILINNAAIRPHMPFRELTDEDWEHVRNVVLDGALYLTRALIGPMVENKYGNILFFVGDG